MYLVLQFRAYKQKTKSVENQSILAKLYPKLVNQELTEKELFWLTAYFNTGDPEELYELIKAELAISDEENEATEIEGEVLERIYNHIALEKFSMSTGITPKPILKKLWAGVAVAAAILIIAASGLYFFNYDTGKVADQSHFVANDIAPGRAGATLTLSNGNKIKLGDALNGKLAKEMGVIITKSDQGELIYQSIPGSKELGKLNMLSTAKGETYQIQLPDGTLVHLNAASTLTYNTSLLENGKRVVTLKGEGYFEVAKDKAHPFVVKSANQEVEVLGTHFNVNAYEDEPAVTTTLLEGSVKLNGKVMLTPGQQALNKQGNLLVKNVNTADYVDWKAGDLNLNTEDFRSVMRKISRWYNVEVVYDESAPDQVKLGGWISRKKNISSVIDLIETTGKVHFKVEGRRIVVTK